MRRFQHLLLAFILVFGFEPLGARTIKKTASGICHPPASSYYERIEDFHAFDSLEECLTNGRLPKRFVAQNSAVQAQSDSRLYERSAFGHGWVDADGDCQDSRAEALITASSTAVRFATDKRCRVVTGRWVSPFTGKVIQNSRHIDIDHVVPLKWAWDRGANQWSSAKRESFANDPTNLWVVELGLNRSKGALPPNKWLPPSGECGYVLRFVRIVKRYELKPSNLEARWFKGFLESCRS